MTVADKRAWAEEVLQGMLGHMGVKARLEVTEREGESPTISVALHPEEEIPGVVEGRRSPTVDALQFLVNKIVNRGPEKKWIHIGVGAHPEPKAPAAKAKGGSTAPAPTPAAAVVAEEAVAGEPALEALGRELAQKAATLGRTYAVTMVSPKMRAHLTRGAQGVDGVRVKAEGEGRNLRVAFLPQHPKPMPKKSAMPDYDDEDEGQEA